MQVKLLFYIVLIIESKIKNRKDHKVHYPLFLFRLMWMDLNISSGMHDLYFVGEHSRRI